MQDFSPLQTAWLRYGAAWLAFLLIISFKNLLQKGTRVPYKNFLRGNKLIWFFLMGMITFFASPYLQYSGLSRSTATANSVIVALEPLIAVFMARLFLGEKMSWRQFIAFQFAIVGFCFLSNMRLNNLTQSIALFNLGNIFLILSLPAEVMYSIISRKLGNDFTPISIFGFALSIGFFFLTIYVFCVRGEGFPKLSLLHFSTICAILWLGPLGTTITYAYWTYALREASVAFVSLTLFVQPIQGTLVGYFYLGERLNIWQSIGSFLIFTALTIQSLPYFRKAKV